MIYNYLTSFLFYNSRTPVHNDSLIKFKKLSLELQIFLYIRIFKIENLQFDCFKQRQLISFIV